MTKQSNWMLAAAAVALLTLAVAQAGSAHTASGATAGSQDLLPAAVRHLLDLDVASPVPGRVAVTLSADGELEYHSFVVESPDRLVVDLPGVRSQLAQSRFAVGACGVAQVRAAQHQTEPAPVARVVFDLERPVPYAIERQGKALVVTFDQQAGVTEPAAAAPPPRAPVEPVAATNVTELIRELEAREPAVDPPPPARPAEPDSATTRAVAPESIERLMQASGVTARSAYFQQGSAAPSAPSNTFKTQTIVTEQTVYSGKEISLNLVDADIKQVFRLFHEISGLNFVLDPSVTGNVTIVLDNVPWDQALDIILKNNGLDKVLENNVIRIATTTKLAQEAASRKQLKEAKELEVEPITITRTLSYGKADQVERVIRDSGVLTARGKVIVDARTNTLIISDIPKKVEPLDRLISTLDAETPQVMIEARVVETSRDFVQDLGVVWGFQAAADAAHGTATGLTFPHNAAVRYGLNLPGEGGASNLAFRFGNVIDSFTLDLALNALEREGYGRVLSSPKVATQNNERAEIEQGVRIPIVNTTATEINVEFVSASLKMVVTPQITAEGTVILEVEVENNSPDFVNTAGGIPSIRTQRAQTKVLIGDGGTTVIGGIFVVSEGKSEVGVPWFRKLPVFGWLFKSKNVTNQNRELLIFITPKIMRLA